MNPTETEIIILPGLFEELHKSFLKETVDSLEPENFKVHVFYIFSVATINSQNTNGETPTFQSKTKDISNKIAEIRSKHHEVVIIGHSLGAYIGLMISQQARLVICLEVSLHPTEMFQTMICKNGICRWPKIKKCLPESFVRSAGQVPDIYRLMNGLKSKTVFIGAMLAGAKISRKYQEVNPEMAELFEYETDHDFAGYEKIVAKKSCELFDLHRSMRQSN